MFSKMKLAKYFTALFALAITCSVNAEVSSDDVSFLLYTPESPDTYVHLVTGQVSLVPLDNNLPFKFIIHGYRGNGEKEWVTSIKNEYMKKGKYNVVAVDWHRPASHLVTFKDQKAVGKYIALLIADLNKTIGVDYTIVHLIGHSLGAHVAGFTGQYLKDIGNPTVGRITGLDAAGWLFSTATPDNRLSSGDADFVDAIHTDPLIGMSTDVGDADFYPNWDLTHQPGCSLRDQEDSKYSSTCPCDHCRAYYLFMESINSVGFISKPCGSYLDYREGKCNENPDIIMGENVNLTSKGAFYLTTNTESPFARFGQI